MSKWSQRAELVYRVFARQMEDSTPKFDEVVEEVEALLEPGEVLEIGEVSDYFLPCPTEKIEAERARGLLLTDHDGRVCYVIRELRLGWFMDGDSDSLFNAAASRIEFAVVRRVNEKLTEVVAV